MSATHVNRLKKAIVQAAIDMAAPRTEREPETVRGTQWEECPSTVRSMPAPQAENRHSGFWPTVDADGNYTRVMG